MLNEFITTSKAEILSIILIIIFIEIIKMFIRKKEEKNQKLSENFKTKMFILSLVVTTIPVVIVYDLNNINEFIAQYSKLYINVQGVYNILKNIFKLKNFFVSEQEDDKEIKN